MFGVTEIVADLFRLVGCDVIYLFIYLLDCK